MTDIEIITIFEIIKKYLYDINCNEIVEQIKNDNLNNWIHTWRSSFEQEILDNLII